MASRLQTGARNTIHMCMRITKRDRLIIFSDEKTREVADILHKEALKTGAKVIRLNLDAHDRPLTELPEKVIEQMRMFRPTASIFAATKGAGEYPMRHALTSKWIQRLNVRHGHMLGVTRKLMETGMQADYAKVAALSQRLHGVLAKAREIELTTPAGTRLKVKLTRKHKWKIFDGMPQQKEWKNLPDGEVFTCPESADGTMVVDGVLGDYFAPKYGPLHKTPLKFEVKNGRVVLDSITCLNARLAREFRKYIQTDKNASRVGEIGLGTLYPFLAGGKPFFVGVTVQDEKMGAHVGIGNSLKEHTGANWESDVHADGLLKNCTIKVDGRTIMRNGVYARWLTRGLIAA